MEYFCAQNLRKKFDSVMINASFECKQGSFTCIVGPSGSGKSTILRLIAGLEKNDKKNDEAQNTNIKKSTNMAEKNDEAQNYDAQASHIFLDGKEISQLPPAKRGIGMVFQNGALFDHLSVQDNVAYGLMSQGIKKREARKKAQEFLSAVDLEGFEKRFPDTLSGGEAQRVALARTIITNPKLILLDEPLSALDAPLRKKLAVFLKEMQQKFNFTAIMVTHDLEEAKQIADRIILIKKGEIYWSGKSEDFRNELL